MSANLLALIAALAYLTAAGVQLLSTARGKKGLSRSMAILALIAISCHGVATWASVFAGPGSNFGIYKVTSLTFLVVNIACLLLQTRRPLQNLLIALFPLSALAVLLATFGPSTGETQQVLSVGMSLHIGSSILAYALLTLAAIQAALVAIQDHQLKNRHSRGIVQVLPPLQLMESMLFELVWIGVTLLSIAISSGLVFVDDIFAQHLVHKSVLSIVAWVLLTLLLWGRHQLGWRAQTAAKFTLAGFILLMIGFLGSKLVLELILQRA